MSLFVINRYDEEKLEDEHDERANLERLKELIERRRQAKSSHRKKNEEQNQTNQTLEEERKFDYTPSESFIPDKSTDIILKKSENVEEESVKPAPQFKVLGLGEFQKKTKVKRVLPYWLSHPSIISVDLKKNADDIANLDFLDYSLKKKLLDDGIKHLFPVQAEVIPWLLNENKKSSLFWSRDVCVSAPTGSGKTLAYVLPIIQVLTKRVNRQIRALVILPVKELATQVAKVFRQYAIGTNLKVALVTGSVAFQQEQAQLLKYTETGGWLSEVDIMVCTAGRLVEHLQNTPNFSLNHLRFLVIDEADRIMDHIQNDWLHHLNQHVKFSSSIMAGKEPILNCVSMSSLRRPPQKLFFSATLSQDPEKLKQWALFQPKLFSAATESDVGNNDEIVRKYTTPLELTEQYVLCDVEQKPVLLYHLVTDKNVKRVLCFTNSAQSTHYLTVILNNMVKGSICASEISSTLSRSAREIVLKKFQNGIVNVLFSTDALARGIDIPDCDLVISYDPPKNINTYIHRVGRTGRAGKLGTAVAILSQNQLRPFQEIMRAAGKFNVDKIEVGESVYEELKESYSEAMSLSKETIAKESSERLDKVKALKRGRHHGQTFNSKKRKTNVE